MKCPKCGNKEFIIVITKYSQANYFVEIEGDEYIKTLKILKRSLRECRGDSRNDIKYPNTVECSKCGEIITIPGELSNEKQNWVRKEAKCLGNLAIVRVPDDAKVEQAEDGYWVDARVWVDKE